MDPAHSVLKLSIKFGNKKKFKQECGDSKHRISSLCI